MVNKYIRIYIKRNIICALACAILVFIPLFVVSCIYDVLPYDLLVAFAPFPIGLVCVAISTLPIGRFRSMITEQEKLYQTTFSDTDVIHLETTLFLSKDWLIWAGSCAIHKKHIQSLKYKKVRVRVGSSNKVIISTVDQKDYIIWCLSASNIKRIREWSKTLGTL